MKNFIKHFRSGRNFGERLAKNCWKQVVWISTSSKKTYFWLMEFYLGQWGSPPGFVLVVGVILTAIIFLCFSPFVFAWAFIKSI